MKDIAIYVQEDTVLVPDNDNASDRTSDTRARSQYDIKSQSNVTLNSRALLLPLSQAQDISLWNPSWLQYKTLLGIATVSLCLISSVIMIFSMSQHNHGLSSPQSKYRYAWTYGPTLGEHPYHPE